MLDLGKNHSLSEYSTREMNNLLDSFIKKYGHSFWGFDRNRKGAHFGFDRIYDDGSCFRFHSHPEILDFLYTNDAIITVTIPPFLKDKTKFSYVIPDAEKESPSFQKCREVFKMRTAIDFIERKKGFYDQIWFSADDPSQVWKHILMNNREKIENFLETFTYEARELIAEAETNSRFLLSKGMQSALKGLSE